MKKKKKKTKQKVWKLRNLQNSKYTTKPPQIQQEEVHKNPTCKIDGHIWSSNTQTIASTTWDIGGLNSGSNWKQIIIDSKI